MNRNKKILMIMAILLVPSTAFADRHGCRGGNGYGHGWHGNYDSRWDGRGYSHSAWWDGRNQQGSGFDWRSASLIRRGASRGELSRREVQELRDDQARIRDLEYRFGRDGRYSSREQHILRDERRDFYKDLKHELNDGERRW